MVSFSLIGISNIFAKTSQITSGELLLSFFANNLYDELGMAEIRDSIIYFEQIDAMLLTRGCFLSAPFACNFHQIISCSSVSLGEMKELDFWIEISLFTSGYLKRGSLFSAEGKVLLIS